MRARILEQRRGTTERVGSCRLVTPQDNATPEHWQAWQDWCDQHGLPWAQISAEHPVICDDETNTVTYRRLVFLAGTAYPFYFDGEFQSYWDRVQLFTPAAPMPGEVPA